MRIRTTLLLAVLAAAAIAAAGCGSSSTSSGTTTPKTTAAAATSPSGAATVTTGSTSALGTFLVDSKGRTLYLWKADTGTKSTCDGACAQAWPPLTTTGTAKAAGGAKSADLGATKRTDGTMQVTYNGHPLYYFAGDQAPGDTTGQASNGFGAEWDVVDPAGNAVDKS